MPVQRYLDSPLPWKWHSLFSPAHGACAGHLQLPSSLCCYTLKEVCQMEFSPLYQSQMQNDKMNMWEALNLSCLAMTHLLTLFMGQFQLFWINQSLYYNVTTMSGGAVLLLGFKVKSPFCPVLLVLLSATHKTHLLILPPLTLHSSVDALYKFSALPSWIKQNSC